MRILTFCIQHHTHLTHITLYHVQCKHIVGTETNRRFALNLNWWKLCADHHAACVCSIRARPSSGYFLYHEGASRRVTLRVLVYQHKLRVLIQSGQTRQSGRSLAEYALSIMQAHPAEHPTNCFCIMQGAIVFLTGFCTYNINICGIYGMQFPPLRSLVFYNEASQWSSMSTWVIVTMRLADSSIALLLQF